jgi:sugar-specific transcriptional regulator TrmB
MVTVAQLEDVGLSTNESKVYLALLRLGSAKAGRIAKEANVERTSTYNALQALLSKGLASYVVIGKVRWFQAAPPERLVDYYEAKRDKAKDMLPELHSLFQETNLRQNVRLFKGMRGVKSVLNDIVATKKENLIFGSEGQLEERLPIYAERFVNELRRKKIPVKSLVREDRAGKTRRECPSADGAQKHREPCRY